MGRPAHWYQTNTDTGQLLFSTLVTGNPIHGCCLFVRQLTENNAPRAGMPRAHSAAMPPQFHIKVDACAARRAPSAPEPLSPDLMRTSSLPTELPELHPSNTPTMAGGREI